MRGVSVGMAVLWMSVTGPALAAQSVVGTITERGSARPVVGAMVRLFDAGAPTGARFLTAADGAYRLSAPGPGAYHVEVERIGFERVRVGPVEVDGVGTVVRDIDVPTSPLRLEGLAVEGDRRRCSMDETTGGRTQLVWDQTRKALDAARWTAREAGLTFQIGRRVRRLGMDGEEVVDESRQVSRSTGGNSVRTLGPDDLAEGGYVREVDGYLYYYGPDADVLLSNAFLETHCFRVVDADPERPDRVGLAFEPVDGRDTTDIRGTMWLDAADLRLDRVEFEYTGLPRIPGRDLARGAVAFLELPDGRWIVSDWFIRAPLLELRRAVGAGGAVRDRFMVTGVQEIGSEVLRVDAADDIFFWERDAPVGTVRGVVRDSVNGGVLAGAEVRLAGRAWRARADREGAWEIRRVPPGTYRIGFSHPVADSLGFDPEWSTVRVEADIVTEVPLALGPVSKLLAQACGTDARGAVVGWVEDGAGARVPGAEVVVLAEDGRSGVPAADARTTTDDAGAFRLCGLPPGSDLRVRAVLDGVASPPRDVRTDTGGPVRVDLRLPGRVRIVEAGDTTDLLEAMAVEGLLVSVDRRVRALERNGFYGRTQSGQGTYLDREAIEALTPRTSTDILSRVASMVPMADGGAVAGRGPIYLFRRASMMWGNCPPMIWVDGAPLRQGGQAGVSLDQLVSVQDIEAMELYPSGASAPVQFTGAGANCGVVVVWTRSGLGG